MNGTHTVPADPHDGGSALLMVVYNHLPDSVSIDAALRQVSLVIFVDNSTDGQTSSRLDRLAGGRSDRCEILRPGGNLGLSKAYNLALHHVESRGISWLYLADHDAIFDDAFFLETRALWEALSRKRETIGVVTPIVSDDPHLFKRRIRPGQQHFLILSAITSGILTRTDILRQFGGFDEDLFVEAADFELTTRMRKAGFRLYCLNRVLIIQDFEVPISGKTLPTKLGCLATRLRSRVRVSLGNANILRTRLSAYDLRRWVELETTLKGLQKGKGLRFHAALIRSLNRLEALYVRIFCQVAQ